jgi:hypothetical protein
MQSAFEGLKLGLKIKKIYRKTGERNRLAQNKSRCARVK